MYQVVTENMFVEAFRNSREDISRAWGVNPDYPDEYDEEPVRELFRQLEEMGCECFDAGDVIAVDCAFSLYDSMEDVKADYENPREHIIAELESGKVITWQ